MGSVGVLSFPFNKRDIVAYFYTDESNSVERYSRSERWRTEVLERTRGNGFGGTGL